MRVLIVEDEKVLNQVLVSRFKDEDYLVDYCFDGEDALAYLEGNEYDALVLDIMLPKIDGIEVVQSIRRKGNKTPVLLLTAKDGIQDRIYGLDSGADDYLTKPFSLEELLARVRTLIRRAGQHQDECYRVDNLVLNTRTKEVKRDDCRIELSSKEYFILEYLMQNKGVVLSREQINNHIWGYDYDGTSNMIDVYIRYLRKKIDLSKERKLIHTIRGMGYVIRESS